MNAIVNIGLVLQRIRDKGLSGFTEAAALCRVSPKSFVKLSQGELPRWDSLMRICKGLEIAESDLIVGPAKPKPTEPAEVVNIKKTV